MEMQLHTAPVKEPEGNERFDGNPVLTREDVRRLNRRLRAKALRDGGYSVKTAFFRCPWPITRRGYEEFRNNAVNKWISDMEKRGWELKSRVAVDTEKRTPAYGYSGDWLSVPLLDQVEIPVAAVFLKRKVERVRIEVLVNADMIGPA